MGQQQHMWRVPLRCFGRPVLHGLVHQVLKPGRLPLHPHAVPSAHAVPTAVPVAFPVAYSRPYPRPCPRREERERDPRPRRIDDRLLQRHLHTLKRHTYRHMPRVPRRGKHPVAHDRRGLGDRGRTQGRLRSCAHHRLRGDVVHGGGVHVCTSKNHVLASYYTPYTPILIHLHYHIYTYVHLSYMYIHHIYT